MTDEQFLYFASRMKAMEVFIFALCDCQPNQAALRARVEGHREVYATASLHSATPDDQRAAMLARIDAFAAGLWGKEG